jgi:hypothetical protein
VAALVQLLGCRPHSQTKRKSGRPGKPFLRSHRHEVFVNLAAAELRKSRIIQVAYHTSLAVPT